MAKINRFEEIHAWQKARDLLRVVYELTGNGPFARDFALRDQVRRAALSIMLNIAEGWGRRTDREFSRFLVIAGGSCAEVQAAFYAALDQKYVDPKTFDDVYRRVDEVARMTTCLCRYLLRTRRASPVSSTPRLLDSLTPRLPRLLDSPDSPTP